MKSMNLGQSDSSSVQHDGQSVWPVTSWYIGEKISQARSDSGDSVDAIAEHVGVKPTLYIFWEKGIRRPTDDQLEAIAKWHGLSVEDLLVCKPDVEVARVTGKAYIGGIKEHTVEESFRKRLIWLMQAYKYSVTDVALKIDAGHSKVAMWVEGTDDPSLGELVAIAKLFNTDVESLVAL